jgi:hypothetical protein
MDYATRPTKVFKREYITDDTGTMVSSGDQWVKSLIDEMKDAGYARVLDIDLKQYIKFDSEKEVFAITYVLHGIYVGKAKAWTIYGIRDGVAVSDTPRTK